MLQHLDTVLAFSVIMLLLSLAVTAVVQFVVSLFGLRGRNLLWGIRQLVTAIDPDLEAAAPELARKVLTHPVLGTSTNRIMQLVDWILGKMGLNPRFNRGSRAPTGIQAKQLLLVLGRVRADLDEATKQKLSDIDDTVTEWFDFLMDACAEKFKLWTRWITVGVAAILVFGLNVDARDIYDQLTTNPAIRASIVARAGEVEPLGADVLATGPEVPHEQPPEEGAGPARAGFSENIAQIRAELEKTELEIFDLGDPLEITPGEILALLLLSFGAPFWYGVLRGLLGLRSIAAEKHERERQRAGSA